MRIALDAMGGDFAPEQFAHHAWYNGDLGRVEMHLVSRRDQRVRVGDAEFFFAAGESIHTENSYKYRLEDLRELAAAGGFESRRVWTDDCHLFSVHYLTVPRDKG